MARSSMAALPTASPIVPQEPEAPQDTAPAADSSDRAGADRRAHRRHPQDDIRFVSKVRLKYGPAVTLVDLSSGGAQIETTNFRLQPGSTVVMELVGQEGEVSVPAQVLRCQLASLLPEPVYRGALVFKQTLDFTTLGPEHPVGNPAKELNPALEQAQLRQVIKRLQLSPDSETSPDGTLAPLFDTLTAAHGALETPAGKRAGTALANELAALFKAVADALQTRPTPTALITAIEDHLRHVVPARAVRLADSDTFKPLPGSEAIFLSAPRLNPDALSARMAVEFTEGCEPLELHFQILKAGVQLLAMASQLSRLNGADVPLEVRSAPKLPQGWSRIVVRHNSGEMRKGFTHNFLPTKGFIHVMPEPVVAPENRLAVPFTDLKAIFFVKDHDGNPGYTEGKQLDPGVRGRKVSITFRDGEELVGTTVNYNSAAPGFFVQPADPLSNNERVFVVAQAIGGLTFI